MGASQADNGRSATRRVIIDLSVMTGVGLLLALVGPFGSFAAPFAWRVVYWVGLAVAGYACYRPIGGVITSLGPRYDLPEWALWIGGCVIATVPMTVIVWSIGQPLSRWRAPSLEEALSLYGYVLAIGTAVTLLFYLVQRNSPPDRDRPVPRNLPDQPVPVAPPRLLERLPPRLGTDLLALEMEDHYVRVHTVLGSDLILMRMRDAIAELDGLAGQQIHRSWWVAQPAVSEVLRDGRNLRLRLCNGKVAPVARNMVPLLKRAGWLRK